MRYKAIIFSLFLATSTYVYAQNYDAGNPVGGYIPDPVLTPGVVDTSCTVGMLKSTTTTGRRNTTDGMKSLAYKKYGVKPHDGICSGPHGCEVDHRVPLEACGDDNQANLWPMPYDGSCNAHDKDALENTTKRDIVSGEISLQQGIDRFLAPDWRVEYQKRFGKSCAGGQK